MLRMDVKKTHTHTQHVDHVVIFDFPCMYSVIMPDGKHEIMFCFGGSDLERVERGLRRKRFRKHSSEALTIRSTKKMYLCWLLSNIPQRTILQTFENSSEIQ